MSNHTPGPWRFIIGYDGSHAILTGKDYSLECVALIKPTPTSHANARLIAAAPDLLEALKSLVDIDYRTWDDAAQQKWQSACSVIAKAEGRTMK